VQRGISANWELTPTKEGTFVIPSPTVTLGGQARTASGNLRIKVVPRGSLPTRPPPRSGPFSMFPFRFDEIEVPDDEPLELPEEARKLALKREPDPYVFIRLVADKESAVVGEQVTLSYYVYYRTDLQLTVQREPALTDFLRVPIEKAPGTDAPIITTVGDYRYHVKLLDRVAVFPLRVGDLKTGIVYTKFTGHRFSGNELERSSNEVTVEVHEPPLAGRPAGYKLGDVGTYTLSATVTPREARVGDTVAVEVKLAGRGSLPTALKIPERTGVEWLQPERQEEIEPENEKVAGWRVFRYAVRFTEAGETDLGAIELPYYDEDKKEYQVARAELGDVRVRPRKDGASPEDAPEQDPFASLGKPRQALDGYDASSERGFDPKLLWSLVVVPPAGVMLSGLVWSLVLSLRRRRAERQRDPAALARRALGDLSPAGDPKDRAAAAERALHLGIEAATGVKSRGVLLLELSGRLEQAGLEPAMVNELIELLEFCATVRFDPTPADDKGLVERTPGVVRRLLRTRRNGEAKAA
jgi:hypothetical protein